MHDASPQAMTFHARSVVLDHPDGLCYLIGFADDPDSPRVYLVLQRAFEAQEDPQEGLTYYLEWCAPERAGWGGVETVSQTPGGLALTFERAVAEVLGLHHLTITFDVGDVDAATLTARLRCMFRDSDASLSVLE